MAKGSGLAQAFFYDGRDIGGDVGEIESLVAPRDFVIQTGLDKSAFERTQGLAGGGIVFAPFFNDATDQEHDALKALPTADVHVMWAMGTSVGNQAVCIATKQASYDWSRGPDKSLTGRVEALANTGVPPEWCDLATAGKRTDTSATNGSGIDGSAGTSNGLIAYLQVFSVTGTNIVVDIEESSDNGSGDAFTSKLAFASATGRTKERKTATGSVERYLRIATSGTFTNAVFVVAFRRGTATEEVDLS